jgi:hypothetical protein
LFDTPLELIEAGVLDPASGASHEFEINPSMFNA